MKTTFRSLVKITILTAGITLLWGCDDNSNDGSGDNGITAQESPFLICAGRNPGGVGIDLDSSVAYNIDDNESFVWDLKIKTYKGVKKNSSDETVYAGAPFIKLQGTNLKAYQWGEQGESAYEAITIGDIDESSLVADSINEVDTTMVDVVVESDGLDSEFLGLMYYSWTGKTGLNDIYDADLSIGDAWKTGKVQNTVHTDDPIYIITSDKGNTFKFMITDFGPDSTIGESGYIAVVWEKL